MANYDFLKSKKLPIGVFAGIKKAPETARIFITLKYRKEFEWLRGLSGFKFKPLQNSRIIIFEIPVMPPTIKLDFGNSKDTENVTRVGEVVLPKYKKAWQLRWESFFPYDSNAPYITPSNRSWSRIKNLVNEVKGSIPEPSVYINLFNMLSVMEEPFSVAMTFYDGGNISSVQVTLETFSCEPEDNGDYKYEISLVQWTDIKPKLLNNKGETVEEGRPTIEDSSMPKLIRNLSDFWKFCKRCYSIVSKPLIFAFAAYNGLRGLVFTGILKIWKIKGVLQGLAGRFGILNNMFGLSKITRKDTKFVSESLKKLSFTKASKQMAEFLNQNKMYRS